MEKTKSHALFFRFNLINLTYTLAVIVWGAFVRASGSGAGCGAHWPLCNGEILPTSNRLQTLIEFTHRSTSGISLLLVAVGWVIAFRLGAKGSRIRRAATLTVVAIILEALLGASLVLLKLVEFDQSIARAVSISAHLVNTLFLLATLVTLTFLSNEADSYRPGKLIFFPKDRFFRWVLGVFICLGISGTIAALGDTLFKSPTLSYGLAQELTPNAHFLIRLRVLHPVFACLWVFLGFLWSQKLMDKPELNFVRNFFVSVLVLQFSLGFLNWILLAPVPLQLIHLLVADTVFIAFWLTGLRWSKVENETRESRIPT
jgi:cytochrome c oxidase assembly protein subunit 15